MSKPREKPVTAFVMMVITPGEAWHVLDTLKARWSKKKKDGDYQEGSYIKGAWVVTGAWDVIAQLEADNNKQLLQFVSDIVKGVPHHSNGPILSTQTAVASDGIWG